MGLIDKVNVEVNGSSDLLSTLSTYTTKILKPNIIDGKNILTQAMISSKNTKYVIKYDYELEEDITIPENCVLEFDGGSLIGSNILTLQETIISGNYPGNINCVVSGNIITENFVIKETLSKTTTKSLLEAAKNGIIINGEIHVDSFSLYTSLRGNNPSIDIISLTHGKYHCITVVQDNVTISNLKINKVIETVSEEDNTYCQAVRCDENNGLTIKECVINGMVYCNNHSTTTYLHNISIHNNEFTCDFTNIPDANHPDKDVIRLYGCKNITISNNLFKTTNVNRVIKISGGQVEESSYSEIENAPFNVLITGNDFECSATNGKQIIDSFVTTQNFYIAYNTFNITSGHSVCVLVKNDAFGKDRATYFVKNNIFNVNDCNVITCSLYSNANGIIFAENSVYKYGNTANYYNVITFYCPYAKIIDNYIVKGANGNYPMITCNNSLKAKSSAESDFDNNNCEYEFRGNRFVNITYIDIYYGSLIFKDNYLENVYASSPLCVRGVKNIKLSKNTCTHNSAATGHITLLRYYVIQNYSLSQLIMYNNISDRYLFIFPTNDITMLNNAIVNTDLISLENDGNQYKFVLFANIVTSLIFNNVQWLEKTKICVEETSGKLIRWNGTAWVDATGTAV